jgi:hypothetical protein
MEGRLLLWRDKGVYKQKHRLFHFGFFASDFFFFLIPLPGMLNHRCACGEIYQETVSTMISRWTRTCFSELRLMVAPRERAESIERGLMPFLDTACHVMGTHSFRASEGRAFLSSDDWSSPHKNRRPLRRILPYSPQQTTSTSPHHTRPAVHTISNGAHTERRTEHELRKVKIERYGRLFQPAHTDMQRSLYNNVRLCNMVIKFSGREIKAHRFVLCEQNKYFEKLFGPDSPFAVSISSLELSRVSKLVHTCYFDHSPPAFTLPLDVATEC